MYLISDISFFLSSFFLCFLFHGRIKKKHTHDDRTRFSSEYLIAQSENGDAGNEEELLIITRLRIIILYVAGRRVLRMCKIVLSGTMHTSPDIPGDVIATHV